MKTKTDFHAFGAAAEDTDVAGDRLEGGGHAVVLLTVGVAARSPRRLQRRRLGAGVEAGELDDVLGLHPADLLGPLRRLRRLVVFAEDGLEDARLDRGEIDRAGRDAGFAQFVEPSHVELVRRGFHFLQPGREIGLGDGPGREEQAETAAP